MYFSATYKNERLGQGRENTKKFLEENPNVAKEIEEKLKEILGFSNGDKPKEQESKSKK